METTDRPRVLIGKAGIDRHDRGAVIVARTLRDAGFEVIYLGPGRTAEEIAAAAIQEDVQAIGLSLHSGAQIEVFTALADELRRLGADEIPRFAGGSIPAADVEPLRKQGVLEIFPPGTPLERIVDRVREILLPQ